MDLTMKTPLGETPTDGTVGQAPCVFCGRVIGHVNDYEDWKVDNCIGCIAGAVVDGEVRYFLYCNEPPCPERLAAQAIGEGVRDCSCEDYRAHDVLGDICHVCKKPPCEPEDAPWNKGPASV